MHTWSCSKYLAIAYPTAASYATEVIRVYSVERACNTLLLIPNKFGTVFGLGVQRLETLEELEIQHSQALAKPERETISHNRLLEAFTFKATRMNASRIAWFDKFQVMIL